MNKEDILSIAWSVLFAGVACLFAMAVWIALPIIFSLSWQGAAMVFSLVAIGAAIAVICFLD